MSRRASLAIVPEPVGSAGPVRVATYSRISTDEERQPNSLEAQRVRLDAFVSSQPEWRIGRRYEDQFTGTVIDRPALTRLLRDAKLDRFDVLLVYRVDRLARSIRGLAQIIDELDQAGVIFRSATEPFDTGTPAGRMMVQMLGVFAEFERALIVERITAGLERKAARGGWCGGQRPYGLDIAGDRDHLERNPTEAPLVPVIFDQYANRQLGSSALATWLNEQGYRTKNARLWSAGSVITVLRNRAYIGEIYYRGNWYPAPHDPLVPKELFEKAQAILTERREDRSRRRSNPTEYLLSSRLRCGRCGKAYIGTTAHGRSGRYTYYTCFTRMRYGTKRCDNDRLPAEQLEQAVTRRLWKVLDDHDLVDRAIAQAYERLTQRDDAQQSELAAMQRKLAETRAALDRYFRAFEAGTMPEDTCAPRIASLNEQATALERRASELATHEDEQPTRTNATELDALRSALRAALNDSAPTRTKTVLHNLIETIRVDARDHIEPTFRVPAVRVDFDYMEPAGIEPVTSCLQSTFAEDLRTARGSRRSQVDQAVHIESENRCDVATWPRQAQDPKRDLRPETGRARPVFNHVPSPSTKPDTNQTAPLSHPVSGRPPRRDVLQTAPTACAQPAPTARAQPALVGPEASLASRA